MKKTINSIDEFQKFSEDFQSKNHMPFAFGIGTAYKGGNNEIIATKWITQNISKNMGAAAVLMSNLKITLKPEDCILKVITPGEIINCLDDFISFENDKKKHENIDALRITQKDIVVIFYGSEDILLKTPIQNIGDAHFRLAAISRLHFKPNGLCLDGIFSVLPNLVYTRGGDVYEIPYWNEYYWNKADNPNILIDKFPPLTWGVPIPEGVRLANPENVRLGAYLSPGTTVMPYGFVNFNAGTLGKSMIEGRISSGTVIGDGTDVGAGAGFLGTLSGGNSVKLSTGKDCLIGANAECGVILGDNCVISTGVCFTQNTPVYEVTEQNTPVRKKVSDFNNMSNITFRRNSESGALEVIHKGNKTTLNDTLHDSQ